MPHPDVASGMYNQAEFAADLWQVYKGEGSNEYRDPAEFFRRTYLTESLRAMLVGRGHPALPPAGATRSSSSRPISAAARPTQCLPCTTCSQVPRRPALRGWTSLWWKPQVNGASRRFRRVVLVGTKISPARP